jgi:hypothetical protein
MPDVGKGVLDGNLIIFMYQSAFAHAAMGIPDVVESPPPPLLLSGEYVKVRVQGRLPLYFFLCAVTQYHILLFLLVLH